MSTSYKIMLKVYEMSATKNLTRREEFEDKQFLKKNA